MPYNEDTIRICKFLSLVLRHRPEKIGIMLDENGWTAVDLLIIKAKEAGLPLSFEVLEQVVENNNKKRFSFNAALDKVRANQGHSIQVDLGYEAQKPPIILYHGTSSRAVNAIRREGLSRQNRHQVHLSQDVETAISVGKRHGKPVVFEVHAGQMYQEGLPFYLSTNGLWLTEQVPPLYLKEILPL